MFIARFNQVSQESKSFKENKAGFLPFIGTVVAGTATATIIDGSIFGSEGLKVNGQLYLCENGTREYEGKEYATVVVVGPLTTMESIMARKEFSLGVGRTLVAAKTVVQDEVPATTAPAGIVGDPLAMTA